MLRLRYEVSVDHIARSCIELDACREPIRAVSLDIDGDGQATALTDGLLIIRYLFGFGGTALVSGALGPDATVTTADAIIARLDSQKTAFDIDGDGSTLPLTDGLLIIRYLFGFQGSALVAGALGGFSGAD